MTLVFEVMYRFVPVCTGFGFFAKFLVVDTINANSSTSMRNSKFIMLNSRQNTPIPVEKVMKVGNCSR